MWNMVSFGILMPSDRTAYTPEGDDRTLQIRARRAKDLDILRALYLPELGETIHTPDFDYNYRAYCTREQYAEAMYKMVMDIDYEKFKPTTDRFDDTELHSVYNSIWGVVTRLGTPWEKFHGRDPIFSGTGRSGFYSSAFGTGRPAAGDRYAETSLDMDEDDYDALRFYDQRQAEKRGSILFGNESRRAKRRRQKREQARAERDAGAEVIERFNPLDAMAVHSTD